MKPFPGTLALAFWLPAGATDYRAGSSSSTVGFGLGLVNGTHKLGYHDIKMANRIADGAAVESLISDDGESGWWAPWFKPGKLSGLTSSPTMPTPETLANLSSSPRPKGCT